MSSCGSTSAPTGAWSLSVPLSSAASRGFRSSCSSFPWCCVFVYVTVWLIMSHGLLVSLLWWGLPMVCLRSAGLTCRRTTTRRPCPAGPASPATTPPRPCTLSTRHWLAWWRRRSLQRVDTVRSLLATPWHARWVALLFRAPCFRFARGDPVVVCVLSRTQLVVVSPPPPPTQARPPSIAQLPCCEPAGGRECSCALCLLSINALVQNCGDVGGKGYAVAAGARSMYTVHGMCVCEQQKQCAARRKRHRGLGVHKKNTRKNTVTRGLPQTRWRDRASGWGPTAAHRCHRHHCPRPPSCLRQCQSPPLRHLQCQHPRRKEGRWDTQNKRGPLPCLSAPSI